MNISLAAEKIAEIGPFVITNTMVATWIVVILLIVLSRLATKNMQKVPGKLQNFFEFIIEALLGLIDGITMDRKKSEKFLPLVATLFLFVVTANWTGLIPGYESIGIREHLHGKVVLLPFLRSAASDLNTTLALAIVTMFSVQVFGVVNVGFFRYFKKFVNFSNPIQWFVGVVESVSEFAKIISFSFRLFGNVFAGGVLLAIVSGLVPIIAPLPFYGLELFVGAIQGLVFAMLATVFLQMATVAHDEH